MLYIYIIITSASSYFMEYNDCKDAFINALIAVDKEHPGDSQKLRETAYDIIKGHTKDLDAAYLEMEECQRNFREAEDDENYEYIAGKYCIECLIIWKGISVFSNSNNSAFGTPPKVKREEV